MLWVVNFLLLKFEFDVWIWILCCDMLIVVFGEVGGEDFVLCVAVMFVWFGYIDVWLFDGGFVGWVVVGGELFIDVNVLSKLFGEWVEVECYMLLLFV